jgi:hypothetical protein
MINAYNHEKTSSHGKMPAKNQRKGKREKSSVLAGRKGPIVPLLGIRCRAENILQTDREKLTRYKLKCREDDARLMFNGKKGR